MPSPQHPTTDPEPPEPDPDGGWPAFRARALADCARAGRPAPTDDQLAQEYIHRCGQRARLAAWMEVHQQ